jgi:hypothetical protein
MTKILNFVFVVSILFSGQIFSQTQTHILDLADENTDKNQTINVDSKTDFRITLMNLIPSKEYTYSYRRYFKEIPVLKFNKSDIKKDSSNKEICENTLIDLIELRNSLDSINEENTIKKIKPIYENKIAKIKISACGEVLQVANEIKTIESLLEKTSQTINEIFNLKAGENLEFTIIRKDNGAVWKYVFDSGERGIWLTSYGFAFISNILKQQKEFIVKKINTDSNIVSSFTPAGSEFDFAPSIFYTWLPKAKEGDEWVYGISGGLGINLESPVTMLGFSITYNWNLNIMLGVAGHIIKKQSESYTISQKITASDVDLLNRKTVVFDPFIAFTFRFGSNPFSK